MAAMGMLPVAAADYVDLLPPFEVDWFICRLLKLWPGLDLTQFV